MFRKNRKFGLRILSLIKLHYLRYAYNVSDKKKSTGKKSPGGTFYLPSLLEGFLRAAAEA
ncbi:hypothetical protein LEP1GSC024_2790 [Leptospira noguchii str. 2001034031]|uniref:Uncharacterized protein n=1 Tax=Leptospira noguchii str. 2001034031 TaxID=1193053 RepID=M6Y5X1_9LEPT|nr:hypothetical protein LEP1GSC024_2790 [Leptospira noguchii str. 2001034031]